MEKCRFLIKLGERIFSTVRSPLARGRFRRSARAVPLLVGAASAVHARANPHRTGAGLFLSPGSVRTKGAVAALTSSRMTGRPLFPQSSVREQIVSTIAAMIINQLISARMSMPSIIAGIASSLNAAGLPPRSGNGRTPTMASIHVRLAPFGPYLLRCAQKAARREDNRRVSNGDQVRRLIGHALGRKPSVNFSGYWQRQKNASSTGMKFFGNQARQGVLTTCGRPRIEPFS
jgi:hypothetical protein